MAQGKRYEITVVPKASFLADQSDPGKNKFVFSYTITITNTGDVAAQLVSRHWIITDATGHTEELRERHHFYGRPCWLLATTLRQSPGDPYAIAVAAADGAPVDALVALLQDVSDDYWFGSSFFK